jgi:hypothetical protein
MGEVFEYLGLLGGRKPIPHSGRYAIDLLQNLLYYRTHGFPSLWGVFILAFSEAIQQS